jgi:exopolyphosphatase / guanosine-5'-triphosphate,3'-diphosphate pyrophosphatase
MTTIGIIDIGTNTILCLKAASDGEQINIISDQRYHYRAGSRLDETGNISPEYKKNLRLALLSAVASIKDCAFIKIVATEVFRRPNDGLAFSKELSAEIGLPIEIIDHQREAELSFKGAIEGFKDFAGRIGVIDIGGGSTELAIGEDSQLLAWLGIKIGAVAISEAVGYEAPLKNYIAYAQDTFGYSNFMELLTPLPYKILIVGGTAVAIAGLMAEIREFKPERLQGWEIEANSLNQLIGQLATMNIDKRRNLMAFDPQRVDIIVGGAAIVYAFMKYAAVNSLVVSTRGLRYGLLNEIVQQINA